MSKIIPWFLPLFEQRDRKQELNSQQWVLSSLVVFQVLQTLPSLQFYVSREIFSWQLSLL